MKYALIILSVALIITGCKKKDTSCAYVAETTVAPASEEAMVTGYLSANNITNAVELENCGLYYSIEAAGSATLPNLCSTIEVKYTGKFTNGTVFDGTTGTTTASFTLGGLIQGWKRTLTKIGAGGKIKLYIPPSLGYGSEDRINPNTGFVIIPGNSVLIFDIEMVSIR